MNIVQSSSDNENKDSLNKLLGQKVFEWESDDYFNYDHGRVWLLVFLFIVLGSGFLMVLFGGEGGNSLWTSMKAGNVFMFITILFALIVYFYVHNNGAKKYLIQVFEKAIIIDETIIEKIKLEGFWFSGELGSFVLNLKYKDTKLIKNKKVSLQMGDNNDDFFRENFQKIDLEELIDEKESIIDSWIRLFKL